MVGATGFEPATSRTPSVCATRLRYAPTGQELARQFITLSRLTVNQSTRAFQAIKR